MSFRPSLRTVIDGLAAEGLADADYAAAQTLEAARMRSDVPWFVRGLVGAGAWLAAFLLVAFVVMLDVFDSGSGFAVFGVILCLGALALKHWTADSGDYDFAGHLALALALAGQAMVMGGTAEWSQSALVAAIAVLVLEGALLVVYPDRFQRFVATLASGIALAVILHECHLPWSLELACLVLAVSATALWLAQAQLQASSVKCLDPAAGHGALAALFALLIAFEWSLIGLRLEPARELITLGLTVGVFALVRGIFRDHGVTAGQPFMAALVAVAALGAVAHDVPGIMAALGVMLLGFHRRDRGLVAVGVAFLILFGVFFYYQLDLTLLYKSAVLAASGALLLGMRLYLRRLPALEEA